MLLVANWLINDEKLLPRFCSRNILSNLTARNIPLGLPAVHSLNLDYALELRYET
jgi:hypothetical protein